MEYMNHFSKKRGTGSGHKKFMKAWADADYPKKFRCDQNFDRIWDVPALREDLERRLESPEERNCRLTQIQNDIRYKRLTS